MSAPEKKERPSLEDRLRELVKAGEMTYLSVAPCAGKGEHGVEFSACYSAASEWGHGMGRNVDIVEAIHLAIDQKISRKAVKAGLKLNTGPEPVPAPEDDDDLKDFK